MDEHSWMDVTGESFKICRRCGQSSDYAEECKPINKRGPIVLPPGIELARAETDADYKAEGHIEVEIPLAAREELTGDTWGVKSIGGRTISIRVEAATNDRVVIEDLIEAYAFLKRLMAKRGLLPTNEPEDRVVLQGAKFWRGE